LYSNNPDENSKQFKKKIMSKIDELLKKVGADFNLENKKVKAIVSSDGDKIINIRIEVLEDNSAKIESEKFQEYVNTLPDDLFMSVLDLMGEDEVKRVNDCIFSNNLESVRAGIHKFKKVLRKVINDRLNELNSILPSCN
jgi:hypothetical protein